MALTLNGSTGLSGIVGSAGTPALQGTDTNTGYFFGTDTLGLSTAGSERLRITAAGNLALGNDGSFPIYTNTNDRNFILGTGSDDAAIQLHSGTDKFGGLYFGDATSGVDRYNGYVEYKHNDNYLRFATAGGERLRITSTGILSLNNSTPENWAALQVKNHTASNAAAVIIHGADMAQIILRDETGGTNTKCTTLRNDEGNLLIGTHNDAYGGFSSKLKIKSDGNIGIGTTSPSSKVQIQTHDNGSGSAARGHHNLLELKHPNTTTTGDGPALLFNGYYSNAEWQYAKISSENSGSGYGAKFKIYVHPADGTQGSNLVQALNIVGDGTGADVTIIDGNLKIGTAGHGIDFGAQTSTTTTGAAAGGTGAEILDHYEEGTWTPAPENVTNTPTYHNQQGIYTRIGNLVTVVGFLQFNLAPTFTSNTAELRVTGLPFTANGSGYESTTGCVSFQSLNWSGSTYNDYGAEGHMTCGAVESTKVVFKVNPAGNNLIRGTLRRKAFEGGGIITWEMTYKTND